VIDDDRRIYAFERNLVLAASAGTGKTHSLVGVVVHLVMGASQFGGNGLHEPVDCARIVATTFSRKAAGEIRARIASELEALVTHAPSNYRSHLGDARERFGLSPWSENEIEQRARRALDGMARAQIGTLHSFASNIVRSHSVEAGLSPAFEFEDEDDSRARARKVVEGVIERELSANAESTRALIASAGGVDALIVQTIRALARLVEDGRGADALAISEDDTKIVTARFRTFIEYAEQLQTDPKLGVAATALVAASRGDDADRAMRAAIEMASIARRGKFSPAADEYFLFRDSLPGDTNGDRGKKLVRLDRAKHAFAPRAQTARALLIACERELWASSVEGSVLSFGDVLRTARDVLRDHPDAARDLGSEIDVFMVDEFQDTSRLQCEIVKLAWDRAPLARAPGALPRLDDLRAHGLLVVGDRKQSIYGFRGADVSVFAEFCVGLAGEEARVALGIDPDAAFIPKEPLADFCALRHNRRGKDELLTFANAFSAHRFRASDPPALYEIAYVPSTEDLLPPPERAPSETHAPRTTWLRTGDRTSKRIEEARAIADRVRTIVTGGTALVNGARAAWKDCAILAQTNSMLDAASFAFAEIGVPYVVAGNGFYTTREVRDLAAMLALIVDGRDKLAAVEVLRGAWAGVHDATLLALTDPGRGIAEVGDAWSQGERRIGIRAEDRAAIDRVRRVVTELARNADRFGAADVLREAVRALSLEETLIQLPRGAQRVANVRKLIHLAEDARSPRAFLLDLDIAAEREANETEAATFSDEDDAVRLLTVHASKGLDFPIVFVPQVGSLPRPPERGAFLLDLSPRKGPSLITARIADDDGTFFDPPSYLDVYESAKARRRAEDQRLAYVAVTRSSDALFLVGQREPPKSRDSDGYSATTSATLAALTEDEASAADAMIAVETIAPSNPFASPIIEASPPSSPAPSASIARMPIPVWRTLPMAPTSLEDFHHCPRRFQLIHILDLPEPDARSFGQSNVRDKDAPQASRLDARSEGTLAHRVLERIAASSFGSPHAREDASLALSHEGIDITDPDHPKIRDRITRFLSSSYASLLSKEGAELSREVSFVLPIEDEQGHSLLLRGTIDLLVFWPDGSVDVVDYKRARGPSPEPYAFQLDVYALAARSIAPEARSLRAGIVFLGGEDAEPRWRARTSEADTKRSLVDLGARLLEARWTETYPRVRIDRCRAIRCGYVSLCHPGL
jgi:ATP-dependent helicase/nuclease subunit A